MVDYISGYYQGSISDRIPTYMPWLALLGDSVTTLVIDGLREHTLAVHWPTGSLVPREGEKITWYLLFAHALNYLTFQSFWISPISRTLNFTLEKWIAWFCMLWTPRLCFCDFERRTNSLRQGHLWRKGHFSGCLQVLASQCAMKYCPSCLMTS